eukprot:CAMPEP_0202707408 /NCGR_PEP_ID=MMETSP1385-20130828/19742_1 /ASSEMBLY_ACC=CAM_ASM_000861 /TAXON_ID=933848 /ORGANISM="Elphidium margaritaceum" /LENGTH=1203 /DNA_ID=CAMNT_0049366123 /DNA_START=38 /DNA_END=3649 /DNA_ORIENTATION=+
MSMPRSYPDDNDQDSEPTPTPAPLHNTEPPPMHRVRSKSSKTRGLKSKSNEHSTRARHSDAHKSSSRTHMHRESVGNHTTKSKSSKVFHKSSSGGGSGSGGGGGGGMKTEGHKQSRSHPSSAKDKNTESDNGGKHYREEGMVPHNDDASHNHSHSHPHSHEEHTHSTHNSNTTTTAGAGAVKKLPNRKKLLIIAPTENQLPSHAAFDFIHCPVGMERKVMWKHFDVMVLIVPTNTSSKKKESMLQSCKKAKNANPKLFVCIIDIEASESAIFRAMCYNYGANMVTNDHHSLKQVLNIIGNKGFKGRKGRLVCPYCGMHGLTEDELWHHVPLYHVNESVDKKMACPVCDDSQHKNFLLHLRNYHGPVQRGEIAPEYRDGITTHAFALVVVRRPSDSKFLVVQEANNSGFWLPGGRVEVGETLLEAAIRETKEEAGIEVDIKGILKVDYSTYAFNDRRAAYNRMRVIFYAEPCDETELPKSVPNYHSAGATFISVDELDKIELRADEPREWFNSLTKHFFYHSLEILSCWKHDQRSRHHARKYYANHNSNSNHHNHNEGDGGQQRDPYDDDDDNAAMDNHHARHSKHPDKHAQTVKAESTTTTATTTTTTTTDSENSDTDNSSLYRDHASNDVDDHHHHEQRKRTQSASLESDGDDTGIALVFDDDDGKSSKRKRERRSDPTPRRLKSNNYNHSHSHNHHNPHEAESGLKSSRVNSVPIDASSKKKAKGKDKSIESRQQHAHPSSINNLPPVHKNSLKAQSTQPMTTISPAAASHSTSNLKKLLNVQKQSSVAADTMTPSMMSQSSSAPQLASQSSVADAVHANANASENAKKETSADANNTNGNTNTNVNTSASQKTTTTVATSNGQSQPTHPHQTVTYRIGPSIYTMPFTMMQMQPNMYNQSGASLLANGLVSPSHNLNPMEMYSDYMTNARRSHIGLPMQAMNNVAAVNNAPKLGLLEKQMSADHAQAMQSPPHSQDLQHLLLQQQIAVALQQQQQQQQQQQPHQQQPQPQPQPPQQLPYAPPYQFAGQHAFFVNQAHMYSSQPPRGLYGQPQQPMMYAAAQPMMTAQTQPQPQPQAKEPTPPKLMDSKSADVHFENLHNHQQPKPELKSGDKKTKNKKREHSRVSHPRVSSLQNGLSAEVLAPIINKPKHKNKGHVKSDGLMRKNKHRRSLSSGVLPMSSSTVLQSSSIPLYSSTTTPPPK